jgi:DnaK suppressor protein
MRTGNERTTDMNDQASIDLDRNFVMRIHYRERQLLSKVRKALQRIDEGTYGICDDCGEEISEERLLARPVTTRCITCKTNEEKQERLKGRDLGAPLQILWKPVSDHVG